MTKKEAHVPAWGTMDESKTLLVSYIGRDDEAHLTRIPLRECPDCGKHLTFLEPNIQAVVLQCPECDYKERVEILAGAIEIPTLQVQYIGYDDERIPTLIEQEICKACKRPFTFLEPIIQGAILKCPKCGAEKRVSIPQDLPPGWVQDGIEKSYGVK
jgi:DNA-directed RNA polymerase subunit M/transcription elongation factor TFIIS